MGSAGQIQTLRSTNVRWHAFHHWRDASRGNFFKSPWGVFWGFCFHQPLELGEQSKEKFSGEYFDSRKIRWQKILRYMCMLQLYMYTTFSQTSIDKETISNIDHRQLNIFYISVASVDVWGLDNVIFPMKGFLFENKSCSANTCFHRTASLGFFKNEENIGSDFEKEGYLVGEVSWVFLSTGVFMAARGRYQLKLLTIDLALKSECFFWFFNWPFKKVPNYCIMSKEKESWLHHFFFEYPVDPIW